MGLFPVLKLLMPAFKTGSKTMQITCRNLQADRLILWSHKIKWNANLMQLGNFIDVFLARHVSATYAHYQEHWMLNCSVWFSAPSFWMGGGLESCCVCNVYGADGAVHHPHHPSKNSVQKTICCNSKSNAPDDGRMYPKHVELRIQWYLG